MIPLPPGSTRTDTRFPYTTLSRSARRRLPSRRDRARLALCPTPRPHATLASERRKPMQAVTEGDRRKELATLLTQIQTHPERDWTAARRRIATLNTLNAPPRRPPCRPDPSLPPGGDGGVLSPKKIERAPA